MCGAGNEGRGQYAAWAGYQPSYLAPGPTLACPLPPLSSPLPSPPFPLAARGPALACILPPHTPHHQSYIISSYHPTTHIQYRTTHCCTYQGRPPLPPCSTPCLTLAAALTRPHPAPHPASPQQPSPLPAPGRQQQQQRLPRSQNHCLHLSTLKCSQLSRNPL